jgi:uncharacterized membrane protein YcjF (UPF0283 family)
MPRFRIKSLLLLIAVFALTLAVGLLSVENARLRQLLARAHQRTALAEAQARSNWDKARQAVDLMLTEVARDAEKPPSPPQEESERTAPPAAK